MFCKSLSWICKPDELVVDWVSVAVVTELGEDVVTEVGAVVAAEVVLVVVTVVDGIAVVVVDVAGEAELGVDLRRDLLGLNFY